MKDNFVKKTIVDRNGNEKIVNVKVGTAIRSNARWRGLEYGWGAEDVAPENRDTQVRQKIQDWAQSQGGEVIARHVKMGSHYVPLVYTIGNKLFVVVSNFEIGENELSEWLESSESQSFLVVIQTVSVSVSDDSGIIKLMSSRLANIDS